MTKLSLGPQIMRIWRPVDETPDRTNPRDMPIRPLLACLLLLTVSGCRHRSQYKSCQSAANREEIEESRQRALDRCEQVADREQRDRQARARAWNDAWDRNRNNDEDD